MYEKRHVDFLPVVVERGKSQGVFSLVGEEGF